MQKTYEYRFRIDAFTLANLPMARLAEYMTDLALLLGEPERVHFQRLEEGSAVLVQTVEAFAAPKVETRLHAVNTRDGTREALKAFDSLDRRLAEDNAIGLLSRGDDTKVIRFPGRDRPKAPRFGGFRQQGSLDGMLMRIGGRDESVHGLLQDGEHIRRFETTRDMARDLRNHLYEKPIRVFGEGRWKRDADGNWDVENFRVSHFEVLDDAPWPETIARLRAIKGGRWHEAADPLGELKQLRDGGEEPH